MLPNAVPKQITSHLDRRRKALDEQAAIRAVYRRVDQRDGFVCRATGVRFGGWLGPREHHHLKPRSTASRAIKHTTRNLVCLAAVVHAFIKAGKLVVVGRNADGPLAFRWTDLATDRERAGIVLRDERRGA